MPREAIALNLKKWQSILYLPWQREECMITLRVGFHRYSTDEKWHVPHFEKMLYDQAILAKVYSEAFHLTKKKEYFRSS
jgi:hypothetical protein